MVPSQPTTLLPFSEQLKKMSQAVELYRPNSDPTNAHGAATAKHGGP